MKSIRDIDTPALIVDYAMMMGNIKYMQEKALSAGVNLRPHTKTHRTPALAKLQVEAGAAGITVAKVGEAEVMAENGLDDIFIANEIVGSSKMERVRNLARKVTLTLGVDNEYQVAELSKAFQGEDNPIGVLIELEVGEMRSGVTSYDELLELAKFIGKTPNVKFKGIFSHEGHTYGANTREECIEKSQISQEYTVMGANMLRKNGIDVEVVSIGSTPSLMNGPIVPGVTEIRPGTYIFMDAAQGHAIEDYGRCAASVLATVVSKPVEDRVVLDAGVKALTLFTRANGICVTPGYGLLKGYDNLRLYKLYDEHGLLNDGKGNRSFNIGDKVEIIPNHICPTCNLYDTMYIVKGGKVVSELPILCRGKSR